MQNTNQKIQTYQAAVYVRLSKDDDMSKGRKAK